MSHPIVDAVTAVFTCGEQGFITVRNPQMPAFPGYHAFPGGKVDPGDSDEPMTQPWLCDYEPRLMRGLCRELDEELGFDLPAAIESGLVKGLWKIGVAVTPKFEPRRFDTRFYRIELAEPVEFAIDPRETEHGEWACWADLQARFEDGQILAVPPTRIVIETFAADANALDLPNFEFRFAAEGFLPCIEAIRGVRMIPVPSHTIPPATATNCYIIGDEGQKKFMVDPSPRDKEFLDKLCNTAEKVGFDAIFLTHHHPDHRQHADAIARRYGIPIHLSQDTFERITSKTAGRFFEDVETVIRGEGDVLTQWLGRDVEVLEVPGHDEGQLALMPTDRSWCIVSDLFQGIGTVVIAQPEGNMAKYFASLQRVIELDPKVVYPSHGMGMGTTYRLQATLAHRKQREQQILQLSKAGKTHAEILEAVYVGLDSRLAPLALCTIESHLGKLREEKLI